MLDVGGQDATEAFEDVGHSDEARETLEQMLVGTLKRQVSLPPRFPLQSPLPPRWPFTDPNMPCLPACPPAHMHFRDSRQFVSNHDFPLILARRPQAQGQPAFPITVREHGVGRFRNHLIRGYLHRGHRRLRCLPLPPDPGEQQERLKRRAMLNDDRLLFMNGGEGGKGWEGFG